MVMEVTPTDGGCPKCHLSDADSDDDGPHEKRTHKLGVIHILLANIDVG